MRKIEYRVIHYHQNRNALEFTNIGVMAHDGKSFGFRLISDDEMKSIHCNIIHKDSLGGLLKYLNEELSKTKGFADIANRHLYFDDFSFSRIFTGKMLYDLNDELASLYNQYVAYKFPRPETKSSRILQVRKESIEVANRKYKKYIDITTDSKIFDMLIRVKKNKKTELFPTIIGSLANTSDINRAVRGKIVENPIHPVFGYIYEIKDEKEKNASKVVSKIGFDLKKFTEKSAIEETFDSMISSI